MPNSPNARRPGPVPCFPNRTRSAVPHTFGAGAVPRFRAPVFHALIREFPIEPILPTQPKQTKHLAPFTNEPAFPAAPRSRASPASGRASASIPKLKAES
jgi:hypothetical protein